MQMDKRNEKPVFSDYLYILIRWKKFIIINLIIVAVIATLTAFLIPQQFKSTAIVMIPPDNQGGFGGLASILGGKTSLSAVGSRIFGLSSTSEDVLLGIINSKSALINVIDKFNLMEYYDIDDKNYDKAIKSFVSDFSAEPNEYGMIEISVINKNPLLAAEISNYMTHLVDSLNIVFSIERAKNNRIFIEQRYLKNIEDLKAAEDSLFKFQKKYGIVAVPEQLEVSIKAAAEIESEMSKKEIQVFFIKEQFGEDSPQYKIASKELEILRKKVSDLKKSSDLKNYSNVLFPFNTMPEIAIQYLRTYRDVQIQQSILEFVLPMYEQSKVEEQKSTPTIIVIDKAVPSQLKYSPKRSLIIAGPILLIFLLMIPSVFWLEKYSNLTNFNNPLQKSFNNFSLKVSRLYRTKISD